MVLKKKFCETKKGAQAANAYRKGETIKNLAEKYGVSMSTISEALRVFGVGTRPRGRQAVVKK